MTNTQKNVFAVNCLSSKKKKAILLLVEVCVCVCVWAQFCNILTPGGA